MRKVRIIETGEEFKSLTACARHIDGNIESIYKCLVGRLRNHKGFTFEYVGINMSYLKLGVAIKNSMKDREAFDEKKFVSELRKMGEF